MIRKWPGLLSLAFSYITYLSWGRYAAIHWRGPRGDWIETIFGKNMMTYKAASCWISLLALGLAIAQIVYARRDKLQKKRIFERFVLIVSLLAFMMGWLART